MIYSDEINRVCGLCEHASPTGEEGIMHCVKKRKDVEVSREACRKFQYDILKRTARRAKKQLKSYSPSDFELI